MPTLKLPETPKGIIGSLLFAWGVLDVIGRLQTAAGIWTHLGLTDALVVIGPLLVWWSIRSEQKKNTSAYEAEVARRKTTPAIWTPEVDPKAWTVFGRCLSRAAG